MLILLFCILLISYLDVYKDCLDFLALYFILYSYIYFISFLDYLLINFYFYYCLCLNSLIWIGIDLGIGDGIRDCLRIGFYCILCYLA